MGNSNVDIRRGGDGELARNLGLFAGMGELEVFGYVQTLNTSYATLTPQHSEYPWQDSAGALVVRSTDAQDTLGNPNGAWVLQVQVLDGNLQRFTVNVPLNGTSDVDVGSLMPGESTQTIWRSMGERIIGCGPLRGSNLGTIFVERPGGSGDVLGRIEPGESRGRTAQFSSGSDECILVPKAMFYVNGNRDADIQILANAAIAGLPTGLESPLPTTMNGPRINAIQLLRQTGVVPVGNGISWLKLPPSTDLEVQVRRSSGGANAVDVQMTSTAYIAKLPELGIAAS